MPGQRRPMSRIALRTAGHRPANMREGAGKHRAAVPRPTPWRPIPRAGWDGPEHIRRRFGWAVKAGRDRPRVVSGKRVYVRVVFGGGRVINKTNLMPSSLIKTYY